MWRLPQEPQPQGLSGAAQLQKGILCRIESSCACFVLHDPCLQNVGDSALCSFSTYCCNIETLNLSTCSKLSDKTLHSLASNCAKLHTLNISSCSNLTDNSLRAISHGCPNVRIVTWLYGFHGNVSFQLTSVNISWCELMTQSGISALSNGCKKLTTFISKVSQVSRSWILKWLRSSPGLSTHWRWGHVQSCQKLPLPRGYQRPGMPEHYRESKCQSNMVKECYNVQDEGLAAICEGCPNIRYLCISNCPHLTDQTLVRGPCLSNSSSNHLCSRWMSPTTVLTLWYWSVLDSVSSLMLDSS